MDFLLVDDSGLALNMLRSKIKIFYPDASFQFAKNGREGVDLFSNFHGLGKKFDLIFLDQLMPKMDGIDCAKEILSQDPSSYIIMVTSNIQVSMQEEAKDTGILHFINKPATEEKLKVAFGAWKSFLNEQA
ncbi:MAG: response regulator [SAR324 cluster bacterium]|nr:response regulator [SAR324 cluster bacterium]